MLIYFAAAHDCSAFADDTKMVAGNKGLEPYIGVDPAFVRSSALYDPKVCVCFHYCKVLPASSLLFFIQKALSCLLLRLSLDAAAAAAAAPASLFKCMTIT